MNIPHSNANRRRLPQTIKHLLSNRSNVLATLTALGLLSCPAIALAQSGSPFDTGFTNLQNLFTGTIAKVASLIAIVIGGYSFAHGEPGAKRTLAGVAAGTGIARACCECSVLVVGRVSEVCAPN